VAGIFDNYIGRVMVMSRAYYREIFGEDCISNQLYIRLNGADEAKLLEKLMKIDGYDSYGRSDSDKALFASSSTLVIAIVALFIFMAAVMAGVVLTNLTNTYILQKKQELTIMRINGFTVREVIGYVTRETVFTTIVGTITGIAMGAAIAYRITRSLETAFVQYNRSISLPAWAFGAVITAFFTIVINVIVLRQVRHLSLTDMT
jgi:ABC-type antimicrobial peptide transport system permease subunit